MRMINDCSGRTVKFQYMKRLLQPVRPRRILKWLAAVSTLALLAGCAMQQKGIDRAFAQRKRRGWEDEATSRAVNAQPWEPPPGMLKRQCPWCRYFFAAPPDAAEPRCPDCVALGSRPASADPT